MLYNKTLLSLLFEILWTMWLVVKKLLVNLRNYDSVYLSNAFLFSASRRKLREIFSMYTTLETIF